MQSEIDPVCRMNIVPTDAAETITYQGKMYYFCSEPCAEQFQTNPGRFINTAED